MSSSRVLAVVFGVLTFASDALAGPGEDLLAKVEKALSSYQDQTITFSVLNLKPGQSTPQSMEFVTRVKGKKSFTEFLSPGDIKGTRVLSLSPTEMYVYLPEFQKIRRVASSATEQGFMGTVLTQQDMAPPQFVAMFDVAGFEDKGSEAILTLKAKAGVEVTYKTLKMTVRKDLSVPTRIDYFTDSGTNARTETRENYACNSGYCLFAAMTMVDHVRGDAWTQLVPKSVQINTGLSEDLFSQRTLQYGP
ncbi:MAG TPA: outer membrane lipoprotein-sorting protein [Myxococcota bacterium]|nr:outer membrane lipoprotein-sorting protein [Myxococcota bacterium]